MARRRLTPARPDYLSKAPEHKTGSLGAGLITPDSAAPETPEANQTPDDQPPAGRSAASGPAASLPTAGPPAAGPPIAQVSGQSAEAAALREVTQTLEVARATGRMVLDVPLADIAAGHLTRDRVAVDDEELAALKASIRAHGQRTPAEISPLAGGDLTAGQGGKTDAGGTEGTWGLISGWRRLRALAELYAETGEARFATIRALVRPAEEAAESYVAMVEENEVRVGLSYYERARIVAEATARGVFADQSAALRTLFATASRAKRSKIASFIDIHEGLGDVLRFPAQIPERLGLAIVSRLRHGDKARLRRALSEAAPENAVAEIACLEDTVAVGQGTATAQGAISEQGHDAETSAASSRVSRAKHAPTVAGDREPIANGVVMTGRRKGRRITLTLEGEGIDDAMLERACAALRGI